MEIEIAKVYGHTDKASGTVSNTSVLIKCKTEEIEEALLVLHKIESPPK
jgi:hypothetical protein